LPHLLLLPLMLVLNAYSYTINKAIADETVAATIESEEEDEEEDRAANC
jgi:hypothetical protein